MVRTRFAPSPTGYMHVGNLRTALFTYLIAKHSGGTFILRIEDTDQEREVPGAIELIYSTLKQVGLHYDEGPDKGGDFGPYIQSERKPLYMEYAKKLIETGAAYYCFCTKERLDEARADAEARGETFKYDKHCLHLSKEEIAQRIASGESYVIRQNIPLEGVAGFDDMLYGHIEVECKTLDDNVLIKADGLPTYNFANVVDDHLMGITHVVRGTEYLSSAPKYNLLYEAFGWTPPQYIHVTPVMRDAQRKLSKRHGDPTFEDLRSMGYLDEAIMNYLALLGWSPSDDREFFTLEELTEAFDIKGLSKSPSIFDINKLTWMNGEYMRKLAPEVYYEKALPWFKKAIGRDDFDYKRLAELLQSRTEVLSRIPEMIDFFVEMPEFDSALYAHKKMKTNPEIAKKALEVVKPVLENITDWTEDALRDGTMACVASSGMKTGQVLWPLRIAITGKESTPGGAFEMAYLLGKDETLRRLAASLEKLT
jgi:glutamyl-tRNA synthetase